MSQVSLLLVRALITAVEQAGVERTRFLADAGLLSLPLGSAHARISRARYLSVLETALTKSGDPALGIHMGERLGVASFDVLGHLVEHSGSLREALITGTQYRRIVADGPSLELDEHGSTATLRLPSECSEALDVRFAAEFGTIAILSLVRRFVGSDVPARRVFFAHKAPPYRDEYTRVFEGREQFGHAFTGM